MIAGVQFITTFSSGDSVTLPEIIIENGGATIRYKAMTFKNADRDLVLANDDVYTLNFAETGTRKKYVAIDRSTGEIVLVDFYDDGSTLVMPNSVTHEILFLAWSVQLTGNASDDLTLLSWRNVLDGQELVSATREES